MKTSGTARSSFTNREMLKKQNLEDNEKQTKLKNNKISS